MSAIIMPPEDLTKPRNPVVPPENPGKVLDWILPPEDLTKARNPVMPPEVP